MHLNDQDYSKLRALKLIRRTSGLSRVELAKALGFNKATVTELVGELLRRGLLTEERAGANGRGRPRTLLSIDAQAAYAISLFPLLPDRASIDIVDLKGDRVFSETVRIGTLNDVAALPDAISAALEGALSRGGVPSERVRQAAVGLPGLVDLREGVVHWLPSSRTRESVPLARLVEERIRMPVALDNRAAAIARAEHWFGADPEVDNFTLIAVLELGMNAARYSDGRMQIGRNGLNSEFSHVKVAFERGRECYCGSRGCLTAYCSVRGIAVEFSRLNGGDVYPAEAWNTLFDEAASRAISGDPQALELFETAGRALGAAVASHINEHDPGRVVIVCAKPSLLPLIAGAFHQSVDEHTLAPLRRVTRIDLRPVALADYRQGAAALALEALYRTEPQGKPEKRAVSRNLSVDQT